MDRIDAFAKTIPLGIDAVLITSSINRRYYLDFPSSAGTVLVMRDKAYFIIDGRYFEAARNDVKNCEVILQDKLYSQLDGLLKKHAVKTLGVESETMSLSSFERIKSELSGVMVLRDDRVSKLIKKQRAIKSEEEIAKIQESQDITDKTFTHILNFIRPGVTELEIAIEMEMFSRRNGSEQPAFDFIVAAGANSSKPHAVPSENTVKPGDFVTLDFGSTRGGYRSDMTRTVAVERISDKQREVYDIVLKAHLAGIKAAKTGVSCMDIGKAARDIIDSTAYEGLFSHGLGHSLGLEIHESPSFNKECADTLEPGMVMSVEPGIYIPGEFGVRIEDIIVATEQGPRIFTKSAKELIIL